MPTETYTRRTDEATIPFGKHAGEPLSAVPRTYLAWLLKNIDLYDDLRAAIEEELEARAAERRALRQRRQSAPVDWRKLVTTWHRQLVTRHHPDRGGSTAVMAAINDAKDELVGAFERAESAEGARR